MAFQTFTAYNNASKLFATYDQRAANPSLSVDDALAVQLRAKRDQLLKDSDWTMLMDTPTDKAVWATYRQALRDLPQAAGFPNVAMPATPALVAGVRDA